MKLYHAERRRSLDHHIGSDIHLDLTSKSDHAKTYANPSKLDGSQYCYSMLIEHFFELIRAARYPGLPSRFASLFACEHDDLVLWRDTLGLNENSMIYEVEGENQFRADGSLLVLGPYIDNVRAFHPELANLYADAYWQQQTGRDAFHELHSARRIAQFNAPKWEYLVQYPIRIVRKLDKQETLRILGLNGKP